MKPGFALDLSPEKIALLHRTGQGWISVGDVAFDDPALDQRLAVLRRTATGLAPHGFATKLILPASQILYADIEAPGPDRASRRRQIADALEGLTPYSRDELAFDWSRSGRHVQVAAVARQTLREAEDFAEAHRFNPVCFVAIPDPGQFAGEPFFGQTGRATATLPAGERLDRDQDPVRIIASSASPRLSATIAKAPDDDTVTASTDGACDAALTPPDRGGGGPDTGGPDTGGPDTGGPDTGVLEMGVSGAAHARPVAPETTGPVTGLADSPAPAPDRAVSAASVATDASDPLANLSFQSRRPVIATAAPLATTGTAAPEDEGDAAPRLELPARIDFAGSTTHDPAVPDRAGPANPWPAGDFGAGLGVTAPVVPVPAAAVTEADTASAAAREPGRPAARGQRNAAPGATALPAEPPRLRRPVVTPQAEAVAMTVFGERRDDAATGRPAGAGSPAGKRRPLLLIAVILVLLIAALALWLGIFGGLRQTAGPALPEPDRATALPPATPGPGSVTPGLADTAPGSAAQLRRDPAPASSTAPQHPPEPAAAVDPQPDVALDSMAPLPETTAPGAAAPKTTTRVAVAPVAASARTEPAVAAQPATGPQPDAPGAPTIGTAAPVPALAPPFRVADAATADSAPRPLPAPPTFGKLVRYDPQGLIVATPDGVVTPQGFTLIAGQPPRLPAARPEGVVAAATPRADERPRERPDDLVTTALPRTTPPPPGGDGPSAIDAGIAAALAEAAQSAPAATPAQPAAITPASAPVDPAHAAIAPRSRPAAIVERAASAAAASAAARAAALTEARARAEATASATPQAVASSRRPARPPQGFARAVDAALAAAVTTVDGAAAPAAAALVPAAPALAEEIDEPEPTAAPASSRTTVARQATLKNAIDLGDMNLIGVFGSAANRRALVRMPSGRYIKLKVGDRFDGGQVAAIGDSELHYVRNGRTVVLKILKNS